MSHDPGMEVFELGCCAGCGCLILVVWTVVVVAISWLVFRS